MTTGPTLEPRTIAVFRALPGLGDLLCAVPALRALRGSFGQARISLIGLTPEAEWFVERFEYVDELLAFPGYPGLPERDPDPRAVVSFLADAQARRFDVAIQMHGSGEVTNQVVALLGASVTAGAYLAGRYCPDPRWYVEYREEEPEIRRNLRIGERLGARSTGEHLEFPVGPADEHALEAALGGAPPAPGTYAVLHPGAKAGTRWPAERFAFVADELAARGLRVHVTGTASERDVARAVCDAARSSPTDLSGATTVGAVAALLRDARIVVCNDTGISHLAAALRVPSVVVFTSPFDRWAPLDRALHRVVRGSREVPAGDVLTEVDSLLGATVAP